MAAVFCVVGALLFPRTMILIAGGVGLYSALRFLIAGGANLRGLWRTHQAVKTDWYAAYHPHAAEPDVLRWEDIRHVVIMANYHEPFPLLADSLETLARCQGAAENIIVVLAMEAAETGSIRKAERLQAKFGHRFSDFYFTVHPAGLPGEFQCKSANQAWSGRWIKRKLVDKLGYSMDSITVTVMDADTQWHPAYFTALTYYFAIDRERNRRFWQAPIRYHRNLGAVHPLVRPSNAYATSIELAYLTARWWLSMPMSSYSLSLRLLDTADYWDPDVIADEWHMYIKAFFARRGNLSIQPIYLPFLVTAVSGQTLWGTIKERYRQTLRHAWGSKEIGYVLANIIQYSDTPRRRSLRLLLSVAHDIFISGAGWLIITLGSQLPILLNPPLLDEILHRDLIYPLLLPLEVAVVIITILALVFLLIDVSIRPTSRRSSKLRDRLLAPFGVLLLPLFAVIFVVIPLLHAQWMLLRGQQLQFEVTKKE